MNDTTHAQLQRYQKNEISEHQIYTKLASLLPVSENRTILERIAADELRHAQVWQTYTQQEVAPDRVKVWFYYLSQPSFRPDLRDEIDGTRRGRGARTVSTTQRNLPGR